MAMINCPECGQEVSEKAKKCVHCGTILIEDKAKLKVCSECGKESPVEAEECEFCGCPFEDNVEDVAIASEKAKDSINKKKLIPVVAAIAVVLIGIVIYYMLVIKPQNTYEEAMTLLEKGKYNEAEELLKDIDSYEDVAQIRKQIKYESFAYSAVNAVKDILKNPDSITIYDINFYSGIEGASDKSEEESTNAEEPETIIEENHSLVYSFLHRHKYAIEDMYNVVIFGYLEAIQVYNRRKDLQKYQLAFICEQYMRAEAGNYFRIENAKKRKP